MPRLKVALRVPPPEGYAEKLGLMRLRVGIRGGRVRKLDRGSLRSREA
jgi:hypothetical protein